MPLTERQIALVQKSFRKVQEEYRPGDTLFYELLFQRHPEMRKMFREDIAGQGMKFLTTLGTILDALSKESGAMNELTDLAEGHAAIGVEARHYAPLGDALLDTFRDVLGTDFTEEVADAWRAAYAEIAAQMIGRGGVDKKA